MSVCLQILICNFAMKHDRVDIEKLTQRLRQAAGSKSPGEIAAEAKVDPSRVTRFLNGDFRKMTPVLRRLCGSLNIPVDKFLLEAPGRDLPSNVLSSLRKIVGRDPARAAAAIRLVRSLEVLASDRRLSAPNKRPAR